VAGSCGWRSAGGAGALENELWRRGEPTGVCAEGQAAATASTMASLRAFRRIGMSSLSMCEAVKDEFVFAINEAKDEKGTGVEKRVVYISLRCISVAAFGRL
jgi:hypothetical protein